MQLSLLHKFHDNTCSLIRFTLYGYLRIMYFRNMFYYGKSKAGSACFAGPAFVVCHARHTTEAPLSGQDSGAFFSPFDDAGFSFAASSYSAESLIIKR